MSGDTVLYAMLLLAGIIIGHAEWSIRRMERIAGKMRDSVAEMNAAIDAFNEGYAEGRADDL